jgi:elongin-A
MEYFQVRSILQRIDSPEQLHQIEIHSPQIKGEDAELWRAFIARDIPTWAEKNYVPKNPRKWYDIYCRYKEEQQKDIEAAEATLKESMLGIQKHRATHVSKVVDMKTLPKLPRDPRMLANNGGVPLNKHKGFKKEGASSLAWTAGSKTKLTDGRSVLTRARREAKEISQMSKLAKPTHQLSGRMGQVVRAPPAMVNEYRTANQPALKILSRKTNIVRRSDIRGGIDRPSLEAREARLLEGQARNEMLRACLKRRWSVHQMKMKMMNITMRASQGRIHSMTNSSPGRHHQYHHAHLNHLPNPSFHQPGLKFHDLVHLTHHLHLSQPRVQHPNPQMSSAP